MCLSANGWGRLHHREKQTKDHENRETCCDHHIRAPHLWPGRSNLRAAVESGSGLAKAEANRELRHARPSLALPVLDVVGAGAVVGPQTPVGQNRGWAAQRQRLLTGLAEAPALAAVRRFVQFIPVAVGPSPPIDDQTAGVLCGKRELLNRAELV